MSNKTLYFSEVEKAFDEQDKCEDCYYFKKGREVKYDICRGKGFGIYIISMIRRNVFPNKNGICNYYSKRFNLIKSLKRLLFRKNKGG